MKTIVLAGGEGSRLRPLTIGRPKPMVPIVNKSVMAHMLDLLKSHGLTEVIATLRYMGHAIQDFFEDGSTLGMEISYSIEESPLGTAGSVKNAAHLITDTFLVVSGDALTDFDIGAIIQAHRESGAMATMALTRVPNPLEYGVIITDEEGQIVQFLEKPGWSEVLSDTVNTGIYVLEPEVLALIPDGEKFDFSQQLFPLMLEMNLPIFGYIAEGYWCDIGNIDEYRRANADLLNGKVNLPMPMGEHLGGGIWIGKDVEIAPDAQLFGPIYLGNEVKLKSNVMIHGPTVIRDYNIIDNYSRIERTIIWRNGYVGESCELRGAVISRQCSVKSQVLALEGVVVGDNCVLGEGATLQADVKLWPRKEVEAGSIINDSIIWGNQGRRALFNRYGVSGIVNVDLTPEFAAKLGAALGATLAKESYVAINRDAHRSSRMLKRAMISGLPGTGINVLDTAQVAVPVVRHFVRNHPLTSAGIHVRISPFDQRVVDIRFMDSEGINFKRSTEREIERTFFREDFRRAYLDNIGLIEYAPNPILGYVEDFLGYVDVTRIRSAQFKLVVDYSFGLAADAIADVFTDLAVDVVPLNARGDESKLAVLQDKFKANLDQAAKIVTALGADLGIQLDVGGEKLFLADEKGNTLDDMTAAALMVELSLFANPGGAVAIPSMLPNAFDQIADWHEGKLIRTENSTHALQKLHAEGPLLLAVDGTGNFLFPQFQLAVDGMMAAACLLEFLAIRQLPMSEVVAYLPPVHMAQGSIDCPWDAKAKVMRMLNTDHGGEWFEKLNGFKIHLNEKEWIHLAPNPDKPLFSAIAEAESKERAAEIVESYRARLLELIG